jgi:hypothetical protein
MSFDVGGLISLLCSAQYIQDLNKIVFLPMACSYSILPLVQLSKACCIHQSFQFNFLCSTLMPQQENCKACNRPEYCTHFSEHMVISSLARVFHNSYLLGLKIFRIRGIRVFEENQNQITIRSGYLEKYI